MMAIPWRERLYLRPREVAEILGISGRSVWKKIESGELPVVRSGRSTRIPTAALLEREEREGKRRPLPLDLERSLRKFGA